MAVDTGIILSTSDVDADHETLEAADVDVDPEVALGRSVPRCSGSATRVGTR